MKQKRVLLVVLILVMITALSGCKKEKESNFTIGSWNENVFENAWLNMKFEIPEDWSIATDEELEQYMDVGIEMADLKDSGEELLKKAAKIKNIYGFMSLSADGVSNMQLVYENLALTLGGTEYSEKDYMDTVTEYMISNTSMDYKVEEQRTVQIAGKDFVLTRLSLYDGAFYQDFYCHKIDNYMVNMIISYMEENQSTIDDIISKINVLE